MSPTRDVYVVSAARTAIGTFGGTLKDSPPIALATTAIKAAIARSGHEDRFFKHPLPSSWRPEHGPRRP